MKRTFIAIKIFADNNLKKSIIDIQNNMNDEKIKWVDINNLHITLAFLGNTSDKNIDRVKHILTKVTQNRSKFSLDLLGFGVFKNVFNPRVLWIGIEKNEFLSELYRELTGHLDFLDYKANHNFSPHLTIGRIKFIKNKHILNAVLEKHEGFFFQKYVVEEVIYYESILTPQGPIYKPLLKAPLA